VLYPKRPQKSPLLDELRAAGAPDTALGLWTLREPSGAYELGQAIDGRPG
jgi:hypothetical protein